MNPRTWGSRNPLLSAASPNIAVSVLGLALVVLATGWPAAAVAQSSVPGYLFDRGSGVATSLFGTYIREGELQIYPFYEYYRNTESYTPKDNGYKVDKAYEGKTTRHEFLLFAAYGFSENFAIELEAAVYDTITLEKDPDDPSPQPKRFTESGLGDTETSLRYRLLAETAGRPELYSYLKIVFPLQKDKKLIGTQDWEFGPGLGVIKGFSWGTLKFAASAEYSQADQEWGSSMLLEYLKRFSSTWRGVLAAESSHDEVEGIVEAQWLFRPNALLKVNVAIGLTEAAPDFAPEIGVLFTF